MSTRDATREARSTFLVSEATLEALEYPSLLALVAELAVTDLGRKRVLDLQPFPSPEDWSYRRELFQETRRFLEDRSLLSSFEESFGEVLERVQGSSDRVRGRDIRVIGDLLDVVSRVEEELAEVDPHPIQLLALIREIPSGRELSRRIRKVLNRRGEVREDASPALSRLRRESRKRRDRLYTQLEGLVHRHREELSEDTITLASGRLVVLLKAGAKGRTKGLIHARSGSGQSFYFEPLEAVDGNNLLQQTLGEAEAEERRILAALIRDLLDAWKTVEAHAAAVGLLDLLQASCKYAALTEAVLPEMARTGELRLVRSRHPLLDARLAHLRVAALGQSGHRGDVVPLDVELTENCRGLVVTGPNAGGKTVVLKTVGLAALAAQSGLPVPGEDGTSLPFLESLVASVGDEQDLLEERSTFSGRLLRIQEALERAGPDSLVLLDEVGSGTDPDEGAALGSAVLETLLEKGGLTLMTSHLVQLAAFALELEGASCGAMESDPEDGSPHYRLVPGPPGASQAIALARRLGIDADLLARAEARLGGEQREFRRLLTEVEKARDKLGQERVELERERRQAIAAREKLNDEVKRKEIEGRQERERLRDQVESFRREVRRKLKDEVRRIRAEVEAGHRKGLETKATSRLFASTPDLAPEPVGERRPLAEGERVRHESWGWEGELVKVSGDRAVALVSGKRVECSAEELSGLGKERKSVPAPVVSVEAQRDPELELSLIGRRVDPALELLDDFLDRALLGSLKQVRVVHGHGSGRLRKAVRRYLSEHPAVLESRAGQSREGGDGATVVTLRQG